MNISWRLSIALAFLLCLGVFVRVYVLQSLPKLQSESVSESIFSGERAYGFLRDHIAVEPHYWDTKENEKVFDFLVDQGKLLEEQYGTDVIQFDTHITNITRDEDEGTPAVIGNVAFLIKGSEHTGKASSAIQISSHYDSERRSPGATDAGAGCAVMLELAHVLASREEKLPYDVMILFVDAEEVGLQGSESWQFGWYSPENKVDKHPWSDLPSVVINIEGSGIANGKEMFIRANSALASKLYHKHVRHPRSLSLSEFLYRVIAVGYTDTDVYIQAGLHCMDLIFVKDRWAYHTTQDTVENVKPAALQNLGNNLVSLVEGIAHDSGFPVPRLETTYSVTHWDNNQDSASVYYSILDKAAVYQTRGQARALFLSVSILAGIGMCFLYPSEIQGIKRSRLIAKHTGIAFLNFLVGLLVSFSVYAAAGSWKKNGCNECHYSFRWYSVWANKEASRSVLSFLSVAISTYFVYACVRAGWKSVLCCCCRETTVPHGKDEMHPDNQVEPEEIEAMVNPETIDSISHKEGFEDNGNTEGGVTNKRRKKNMFGALALEGLVNVEAPHDLETDPMEDFSELERVQLARIAHVGIFFFLDILLFVFTLSLPDLAPFVFFQAIFFWIASFAEAGMERFVAGNDNKDSFLQKALRTWALLRSFLSVIPSLFVIPDGFMLLTLYFGFFLDELGVWYGIPLLEAFNFGLVVLVIVPSALLLPTKYACVLGYALLASWLTTMVVVMAI